LVADRRFALQKGAQEFAVAVGVGAQFRRRQAGRRLVPKAVAGDLMPRRRKLPKVIGIIEDGAFHRAAAESAGRIISAPHTAPGHYRTPQGPGILGKIVKRDAGHRPVPGQAGGPDRQLAGHQAGQLGSQMFRQAHLPVLAGKALKPG